MSDPINEIEARILGSLVEKQLTTPEYYPLTLNALINACNQKNNRDPVMSLDEASATQSLESLRDRNLVYVFYGSTSRVPKYKHMLPSVYELDPAETAVVAVLLMRGPQTIGELRERTGRMHEFADLGEVQQTLDGLVRRDEPLISRLDKLPGSKEARYVQLLTGQPDIEALAVAHAERHTRSGTDPDRVKRLEDEIALLKTNFDDLRARMDAFIEQFK